MSGVHDEIVAALDDLHDPLILGFLEGVTARQLSQVPQAERLLYREVFQDRRDRLGQSLQMPANQRGKLSRQPDMPTQLPDTVDLTQCPRTNRAFCQMPIASNC